MNARNSLFDPRMAVAIDAAWTPVRPPPEDPDAALARLTRGPRRTGLAVASVFVAVFGVWGSLAPLAGGASAPAVIAPDAGVRVVQHLEGGIVRTLHVREGDRVAPGDPLVTLEDIGARAEVGALLDRRRARLAEAARLEAELRGLSAMAAPEGFDEGDPAYAAVLEAERRLFEARREMLATRKRVLAERIAQLGEEIAGFEAQVESASGQLALIEEELEDKSTLLAKGLAPKGEVLRLRRMAAEIEGFRGEHLSNIARARRQIGEAELELVGLDAERAQEIATRGSALRNEIAEIEQTLAASRDVLERTVIPAPIGGLVDELHVNTIGGVVGPGEPILEIVPTDERLLLDAEIAPSDIDVVHEGLEAKIHLSAYSGRVADEIIGRVVSVSADARTDERGERSFYLARVEAPREALDAAGMALTPGMTAEVLIVTERRTMLEYLLEPLSDLFRRAFRET